jgi:uncharacterized membrane protein
MIYALALVIGIVAGLRAMLAPTAVSWAAGLGVLDISGTGLAFLGYRWTPWVISLAAIGELVNDKLPNTPSRKILPQFTVRVVMGGLSGAVLAFSLGNWVGGLIMGVAGAVLGTYGGAAMRSWLAKSLGSDLPAALIEDLIAIVLAVLVVCAL